MYETLQAKLAVRDVWKEVARKRDNNTISLPLDQIDSVTPRYRYSARDTVIIGVTAHIGRIAHMGAIAPCAIKNPGFK